MMSSPEYHQLSLSDLPDARQKGSRLRASCPIHGSDHQRSLSINLETGFGFCHSCHAKVFVSELAPESQGTRTRLRLLRQAAAVQRGEATPQSWQQEELAALEKLAERARNALERAEKARAYLEARRIPLALAKEMGLGYIPPSAARLPEVRPIRKWVDRLIFPLGSPDGPGYAGRSLHSWHPGMDENEHKRLLDKLAEEQEAQRQLVTARRWEKTYPAGWFGYAALWLRDEQQLLDAYKVTVEGPFDRLALIAGGVDQRTVFALVGTAGALEWLPPHVRGVILGLDADQAEKETVGLLAEALYATGIEAFPCLPPGGDAGKDWSERWRRVGLPGLAPVLEMLEALACQDVQAVRAQVQQQRLDDDLPGTCVVCNREVELYTADGTPYCAFHNPDGQGTEKPAEAEQSTQEMVLAADMGAYGVEYRPWQRCSCGCALWHLVCGVVDCCNCHPSPLWSARLESRLASLYSASK